MAETIKGRVTKIGGGEVRICVDFATNHYPPLGAETATPTSSSIAANRSHTTPSSSRRTLPFGGSSKVTTISTLKNFGTLMVPDTWKEL